MSAMFSAPSSAPPPTPPSAPSSVPPSLFVEETRFGNWFLRTATWKTHVLHRALDDLQRLMASGTASPVQSPRVLDVGCGFGHSFDELSRRFGPSLIIGLDADPAIAQRAGDCAGECASPVQLHSANAAATGLPDDSVDIVFCHQTFHHIVAQEAAMREFMRVLKPGGVLLFAESTRRYIHSLPIRLLFRHPMHVQRTAGEYVEMVRAAGFAVPEDAISLPYLWWSRPDVGFLEWIGRPVPARREETLVNLVATKPA